MFKNYKGIFKDLRDMQDRMWRECSPGFVLPPDMNKWQQQTLENTNKLLEQAVRQSLDLQRLRVCENIPRSLPPGQALGL
jgi:hypothetical protein